jgi:hypothetical protein
MIARRFKKVIFICGECEKYFELLGTHFYNEIYYSLKDEQLNNKQLVSLNLKNNIATCKNANQNIRQYFIKCISAIN